MAGQRKAQKEQLPRRRGRQKLLPADALCRLKHDLGNATDLEPVVVYAADLRTMLELVRAAFERRTAHERRWLRRPPR
jgi:hypothetical protein